MRLAIASWTVAIGLLLAPARALAADESAKGKKEFHLTMPHTQEQCLAALDHMAAKDRKLFEKTKWGCKYGDHTGYVTVTAPDEKAAMAMVPEEERGGAKVQQVGNFTAKELAAIHKKKAEKEKK